MRKRVFGKRLKRDINERKALFKSLMTSLVLEEKIKTTEAKAKAVRGEMEKFVTKAKLKGEEARRHLTKYLAPNVVDKVISDIAPRFKERPGGYLRILKLNTRIKDNAHMVLMEWVEEGKIKDEKSKIKEKGELPKEKLQVDAKISKKTLKTGETKKIKKAATQVRKKNKTQKSSTSK